MSIVQQRNSDFAWIFEKYKISTFGNELKKFGRFRITQKQYIYTQKA